MRTRPPFMKQLITNPKEGWASHTKLMSLVGAVIASFVMVHEAVNARMNADYFWAYLGTLIAGRAASKFIDNKGKPNGPSPTELPKE